ncbi:hypothetical protein ABKN59_004216 [Abortiporus biennis]
MPASSSSPPWSSQYENWYQRTSLHPSPSTFTPTRESLVFSVLRSTPVDPEGYTVSFFKPNIAVDAMGRILDVKEDDFTGISNLAQQTLNLPQTGRFRNTWVIAHDRTSQPIDRLLVPNVPGEVSELSQTSVQGYEKGLKNLKTAVGDIHELPAVLNELFGLVAEGRTGYTKGEEDVQVIAKVKDILGGI